MAQSLNVLVSILSDRVGKPFNIPLQQELKEIIKYKRVNYMQQFLEKHPEQRIFFTQEFTAELEKVPANKAICGLSSSSKDCPIMATKCEVPQPIRNTFTLFDFVGEPNFMQAYGQVKPEFLKLNQYNTYTSTRPKWFYSDNRIVVYKDLTTKYVGVRGVFENPEDINDCLCDGKNCFDDDSPFPAPGDLINAIMRDILNVELRNLFPNIGEVAMDDKQPQETGK